MCKEYTMDQLSLPMDLQEDIPENHLLRVINDAVNRLDMKLSPGGGRDSYHPKMLMKVVIYAYTQRIYSSRQIARAVRENIMFMWLAVSLEVGWLSLAHNLLKKAARAKISLQGMSPLQRYFIKKRFYLPMRAIFTVSDHLLRRPLYPYYEVNTLCCSL
ncbi:hypothetical protein MU1_13310 [Paenibacillus glycanilyticus]|uniref:Transposase InsH N-terminal domain-containing protein n=1 Tax=Paenibacillus glycanilyticus TaxID=126569 RepID=A0ABQ6G8P8_9BACL|nr:transposase [Paenibacillus glycanilyticus]GLX66987.1 hypothetical protein MU1_13310 [Paenibacillus glycanilyticus]